MSYRVEIRSRIQRRIIAWNLSDSVFVEVMLRLHQQLGQNPTGLLHRTKRPFNGMTYMVNFVDPANRFSEHTFLFHVVYGQDEETLFVVNCAYELRGM